jgi:hypothetical protein
MPDGDNRREVEASRAIMNAMNDNLSGNDQLRPATAGHVQPSDPPQFTMTVEEEVIRYDQLEPPDPPFTTDAGRRMRIT